MANNRIKTIKTISELYAECEFLTGLLPVFKAMVDVSKEDNTIVTETMTITTGFMGDFGHSLKDLQFVAENDDLEHLLTSAVEGNYISYLPILKRYYLNGEQYTWIRKLFSEINKERMAYHYTPRLLTVL